MKDILSLTKIFLKNREIKTKSGKKRSGLKGWVIIFIYVAACMSFISYDTTISLKTINNEALMVKLGLLFIILFLLIRSFFTTINYLYFSKDNESLIALPIKPYKLVMAKFLFLIITEYFMIFATAFPMLVTNGIVREMPVPFYIWSAVACILLPIIPIIVTGLILTFVMRFTRIIRNQNVMQYLSVFASIVICVVSVGLSTQNQQVTDYEMGMELEAQTSLINSASDKLLIINPMYNIIEGNNTIQNALIIFGSSIAIFVLGSYIVSIFFVKTVAKCNSSSGFKAKKLKIDDRTFLQKHTWRRYVGKEVKLLFRNPLFCFQCLLPVVLMPLMLTIGFLANEQELLNELRANNTELSNMLNSSLGLMIILLSGVFFFMFNYLSITAVSREGNDSLFMKYIPVSLSKQAYYKIIPGIVVDVIVSIYLILFLKIMIPGVSMNVLGNAFLLLFVMNIYNNYIGIVRDLKHPKLGWTSEYEVIKRNLNMFYQTLTTFVQIVIISIICAVISNANIYTLIILVIYTALIAMKINYIRKHERDLLENIY